MAITYKAKGKPKKAKAVWSANNKITQCIRKVWRNSPLRKEALAQALVLNNAKARERSYTCSVCGVEYREFDIEVDHIVECGKGASWDSWIDQQMCGVVSIDTDNMCKLEGGTLIPLADIVKANLRVLCRKCHIAKGKADKPDLSIIKMLKIKPTRKKNTGYADSLYDDRMYAE